MLHAESGGGASGQHCGAGVASPGGGVESLPGFTTPPPLLHHSHACCPQIHTHCGVDPAA